jgi:hypothetical protein
VWECGSVGVDGQSRYSHTPTLPHYHTMTFPQLITLAACLLLCGCSGAPEDGVNAERAEAYKKAYEPILAKPDQSITALASLKKQDAENALPSYLLAAAYARKEDWADCLKHLKEGNAAPRCVYYVTEEGLLRRFDGYTTLRRLAIDCAGAAARLGLEKAPELLREVDRMGKRVANGLPKDPATVMAGISIRGISQGALVDLYDSTQRGADSDRARASRAHLRQWSERTARSFAEAVDPKGKLYPETLLRKHKLTPQEVRDYMNGSKRPAETKKKLMEMTREVEELQRPLVEKALKEMPE